MVLDVLNGVVLATYSGMTQVITSRGIIIDIILGLNGCDTLSSRIEYYFAIMLLDFYINQLLYLIHSEDR